ncbi:MAG: hypothetical protein J0H01_15365 [Rhizobiales bacterium]|nr:hypothetical protein [Hyphomicrobiales bacterium]
MKKAIIYDAAGADPRRDRIVRKDLTLVAVGDPAALAVVAADLARDGAGLIELCGAISPRWRPIVQAAVGPQVRVSSVTFGIESLAAAARFSQASIDGTPPPGAFIFIEAGADPRVDRFARSFPPQHTTFVAVPDETAAAAVARELTGRGVGLIELYGGFTGKGAAAVIDAVDGRAAVGIGSFTLDAIALPAIAAA